MPRNACGEPADRGADALPPWFAGAFVAGSAVLGVFAICMSLVALDTCRARCNRPPGPWARYFFENAYAVYLVHPLVVIPVTLSVIAALRAAGAAIDFAGTSVDSASCVTPPGLRALEPLVLAAAFAAALAASLALVFPLASAVRAIPCVRRIIG
jgi:hypothetical protein